MIGSEAGKYFYDADAISEKAKYYNITGMDATGYKDAHSFNGKHKNLMDKGIEVRSGFWPLNEQKGFKFKYINGVSKNSKNMSKKIFEKTLVLPSSTDLKRKDVQNIFKTIYKVIKK